MEKLLLIGENDLKKIISEAVTNAVDTATRKIAARSAVVNYKNRLFTEESSPFAPSFDPVHHCTCGNTGGCGADETDGGCGGGRRSSWGSSGGCGGGWNDGGC